MIGVDDCFISQNVMLPLLASLHDGLHLFVIGGVFVNNIR
jgi:hypothetical protein